MAAVNFKAQYDAFVNSMFLEGLLDEQFQQLQMLEDGSCPGFVAEVIKLFCDDCERMLNELSNLMDQVVVDYQKVASLLHQLKGSSASVGANNVKLASMQFRQFCDANDKEGCFRALNVVRHEYYRLQGKFNTMSQLESRILAYEKQQQN